MVEKPDEWELVMWYDLSPMRPDEYAETNARRWVEATTLRTAGESGQRDAAKEAEGNQKLLDMRLQA